MLHDAGYPKHLSLFEIWYNLNFSINMLVR
jgi:hypothetical protein